MIELLLWVLFTLALAALLTLFVIWFLPRFFMGNMVRGLRRRTGRKGWNLMGDLQVPHAGHTIRRPNPDVIMRVASFDVEKSPVHLKFVVPDWDTYWSVTLYAWSTENFYVINDRAFDKPLLDLVITTRESAYQPNGAEDVAISPTFRGLAVLRVMVQNREDPEEMERAQTLLNRAELIA